MIAARFITPDMIKGYQIAGTPEECSQILRTLIRTYRLDVFLLNLISPGLAANTTLMREVADIVKNADEESKES